MKTKSLLKFLAPVLITGMLASCSSSNQVASSFSKRKYTKGFFFDRSAKPESPVGATASKISTKSILPATSASTISHSVNSVAVSQTPVVAMQERKASVNTTNKVYSHKTSLFTKNDKIASVVQNTPAVASNASSSFSSNSPAHSEISASSSSMGSGGGGGNCKSWIAAVLLCFFLGGIGIHRFYLGYTWQGIVQLLTGGGCGIWALIDFIRILMKTLKPKNGDYCE